jgi:hypothetical protein
VTTTPPTSGPSSAVPDYPYAQSGDVTATTNLSSPTSTVGVPVDITVTLTNTRDYGVFVISSYEFAIYVETQHEPATFLNIGFNAPYSIDGVELAPHASVTASARWVPTTAGTGTVRLVREDMMMPQSVNVTQTPTPFTVAPGETTTTTSVSTTTTP